MTQTELFLSYAREDQARAEVILQGLIAKGWNVFYDQQMYAGADWRNVLEAQLRESYAVVVVWSKHSVVSDWVAIEAAAGLAKERLFPVLIDRGIALPSDFEHKHAVDLTDWNGDANDPKFARLVDPIETLWESQKGLRKDIKVLKPFRLKGATRPNDGR